MSISGPATTPPSWTKGMCAFRQWEGFVGDVDTTQGGKIPHLVPDIPKMRFGIECFLSANP